MRSRFDQQTRLDLTEGGKRENKRKKQKLELMKDIAPTQTPAREPCLLPTSLSLSLQGSAPPCSSRSSQDVSSGFKLFVPTTQILPELRHAEIP